MANGTAVLCAHAFEAQLGVRELQQQDATPVLWLADLQIACSRCGAMFEFVGLRPADSFAAPSCDETATLLCVAIKPSEHFRQTH